MSRPFIVLVVMVVSLVACAPAQQRLYEDGGYRSYAGFEGAAFMPDAPIEAVELVWLQGGVPDNNQMEAVQSQERCPGVVDQDRCVALLLDAVAAVVSEGIDDEVPLYVLAHEICINCGTELGYLFAISDEEAWLIDQAEAIEIFGAIDAPGEAVIVLGELAPVRSIEGGFELVTTSAVCNPAGPRRTVWTVDVAGAIDRGVEWMENSGQDCHDI